MNSREQEILGILIDYYTKVGESVGSKTLVDKYNLDYSSATVRNVLHNLEERGYIEKSHISSGRVPTIDGYKFYIKHLVERERLTIEEIEKIKFATHESNSAKLLSNMTSYTGLALEPSINKEKLRKIELVYINSTSFLAVVVSDDFVKTKRIVLTRAIAEEDLKNLSIYMNAVFKDQILEEIKLTEQTPLKDEKFLLQNFLNQLESRLHIEGVESLISFLVMNGAHSNSYKVFNAKDEIKSFLEKLVDNLDDKKINIVLGDDLSSEKLKGLSFVFSTYERGNSKGMIGIVGPRRMEYSKISSIVEKVSDQMRSLNVKRDE